MYRFFVLIVIILSVSLAHAGHFGFIDSDCLRFSPYGVDQNSCLNCHDGEPSAWRYSSYSFRPRHHRFDDPYRRHHDHRTERHAGQDHRHR